MKCSDLQIELSLFIDGLATDEDIVKEHLGICPICRQRLDEIREVRTSLRSLNAPGISDSLKQSLKRNVRAEIGAQKDSRLPFAPDVREWIQMQVMPYGVGVFASLLVGVTLLTVMFSGLRSTTPFTIANGTSGMDSTVLLASNSNPFAGSVSPDISPAVFAGSRFGFASESPSVNPQGALVALTRSLIRGGMKDDEVVVVADVFGNGLARIAEVVEPSRDRRAVSELEKALASDPAYAPFVPSSIEERPETVRVVLKFQNVDVSTAPKRTKRNR